MQSTHSDQQTIATLEPGQHYWCTCGSSQNYPLCDGNHRGTQFVPLVFETTQTTQLIKGQLLTVERSAP